MSRRRSDVTDLVRYCPFVKPSLASGVLHLEYECPQTSADVLLSLSDALARFCRRASASASDLICEVREFGPEPRDAKFEETFRVVRTVAVRLGVTMGFVPAGKVIAAHRRVLPIRDSTIIVFRRREYSDARFSTRLGPEPAGTVPSTAAARYLHETTKMMRHAQQVGLGDSETMEIFLNRMTDLIYAVEGSVQRSAAT